MEILTVITLVVIVGVVLIMKISTDKIEHDSEGCSSYDSKYEVYSKKNDWHCNRRGRITDYWENDR